MATGTTTSLPPNPASGLKMKSSMQNNPSFGSAANPQLEILSTHIFANRFPTSTTPSHQPTSSFMPIVSVSTFQSDQLTPVRHCLTVRPSPHPSTSNSAKHTPV